MTTDVAVCFFQRINEAECSGVVGFVQIEGDGVINIPVRLLAGEPG